MCLCVSACARYCLSVFASVLICAGVGACVVFVRVYVIARHEWNSRRDVRSECLSLYTASVCGGSEWVATDDRCCDEYITGK